MLDILSDLMSRRSSSKDLEDVLQPDLLAVLSIPIFLLWKAKMKLKQKLGLALFLTLNVWMIVISLLRAALAEIATANGRVFDTVWCLFWVYVEAFVATFVASLAAVRFIFARQGSKESTGRIAAAATVAPSTFARDAAWRSGPLVGSESLDLLSGVPAAKLRDVELTSYHSGDHAAGDEDIEERLSLAIVVSELSNAERDGLCNEESFEVRAYDSLVIINGMLSYNKGSLAHEKASDRQFI